MEVRSEAIEAYGEGGWEDIESEAELAMPVYTDVSYAMRHISNRILSRRAGATILSSGVRLGIEGEIRVAHDPIGRVSGGGETVFYGHRGSLRPEREGFNFASVVLSDFEDSTREVLAVLDGLVEDGYALIYAPKGFLDGANGDALEEASRRAVVVGASRTVSFGYEADLILLKKEARGSPRPWSHTTVMPRKVSRFLARNQGTTEDGFIRAIAPQDAIAVIESGVPEHVELPGAKASPVVLEHPEDGWARYQALPSGDIWIAYRDGTSRRAASMADSPARARRLSALTTLGRHVREILDFEDGDVGDDEVDERIARLTEEYESFARRNGYACEAKNARLVDQETDEARMLLLLDETDAAGRRVGPGPILRGRLMGTGIAGQEEMTPGRALRMSLDKKNAVDLDYIARLLDTDEPESALGDLIVRDPDTDVAIPAEEYLSGDIAGKIRHVKELIAQAQDGGMTEAVEEWRRGIGIYDVLRPGETEGPAARARNRRDDRSPIQRIAASPTWAALTQTNGNVAASLTVESLERLYDRVNISQISTSMAAALASIPKPGVGEAFTREQVNAMGYLVHRVVLGIDGYYAGNRDAMQKRYLVNACMLALSDSIPDEALDPPNDPAAEEMRGWDIHRIGLHADRRGPKRLLRDICDLAEPGAPGRGWSSGSLLLYLRNNPALAEFILCEAYPDGAFANARTGERWSPALDLSRPLDSYEGELIRFKDERAHALAGVVPDAGRIGELEGLQEKLEGALPEQIAWQDIYIKVGAPWIPARMVFDFALDNIWDHDGRVDTYVTKDARTGRWKVGNTIPASDRANRRYGVQGGNGATPTRVFSDALASRPTIVTHTEGEQIVSDDALTTLAEQRRANLEMDFREWMLSTPERREEAQRLYNEHMNGYVRTTYDGGYLTFPGKAGGLHLHDHQRSAIARALRSPEGTLVAHEVGAGKTYVGICAAHKARELGRCTKPLVVVPNAVVGQWSREWSRAYPQDKVLVMESGCAKATADHVWRAAAEGEWDAVIVPQSRFNELPAELLSPTRLAAELRGEIERLNAVTIGDDITGRARRAEARRLERQVDGLVGQDDPAHTFESMGFDYLVVDESHQYNTLGVKSGLDLAGINTVSSNQARHLFAICSNMQRNGMGSNILFLTGTPFRNTVGELYIQQRYLAPHTMAAQGIVTFDDWAATYAKTVRKMTYSPDGTFKQRDALALYENLPELTTVVSSFCDIVTEEDLVAGLSVTDTGVPKVETENVAVAPSPAQLMGLRWIAGRAERIRRRQVKSDEDNLLLICNDAAKLALDPKLLFIGEDDVGWAGQGLVSKVAQNVRHVWAATTASPDGENYRGTQLVFCDMSQEARAELARRLVVSGIPANEIAIIEGGVSSSKRQKLCDAVNEGEIRVLIGATKTIGQGVSVQRRLAAIHNMDCPWTASDLKQRRGRIARQGNMFYDCDWWTCKEYRYVTERMGMTVRYQRAAEKAAMMAQILSNKTPAREAAEVDDTTLSLEEMCALSAGDPEVRRRFELEQEVNTLRALRSGWVTEKEAVKEKLEKQYLPEMRRLRHDYGAACGLLEAIATTEERVEGDGLEEGKKQWVAAQIGDGHYDLNTEDGLTAANAAAAYLVLRDLFAPEVEVLAIGEVKALYRSVPVVDYDQNGHKHEELVRRLVLRSGDSEFVYPGAVPLSARDASKGPVITTMNALRRAPRAIADLEKRCKAAEETVRNAESRINERWERDSELDEKRLQLERLPVPTTTINPDTAPTYDDLHAFLAHGVQVEVGVGRALEGLVGGAAPAPPADNGEGRVLDGNGPHIRR